MDNTPDFKHTPSASKVPKPPDPHAEMMRAFVKFQEAAKAYAVGVGVKHIRVVGDALSLDTCKLEFSSY